MKNNKTLLIFLIVLNFIFINISFSDDIIFETNEIQALDEGNILKANKGGKAIINNNTEIIADKFEYNKISEILVTEGNVKIIDKLNNITTQSNKIFYYKKEDKYISEEKTKIIIEKKYTINSKDIVLSLKKKQLSSDKNTTVEDEKNNYYIAEKFKYLIDKKLLRGKRITIKNENNDEYFFEDAFINLETKELHGKDLEFKFANDLFGNNNNEPRLKGNKAYTSKNFTKVSKGVFTTCKVRPDKKCPPWLVEANEVSHDKDKKTIFYKNAWLKIYDVPVLYFPYFFHPDPTVKRQSGFLAPQVGDSEILGSSAYIPYFYVISDKQDITFKPRFFSDTKYSLQTEYRKASKNSSHILDFSLTGGHESHSNDGKNARSHLFSNSIIDLDIATFDISNLEVQVQKTTNDTYLKLFDLKSPLIENSEPNTLNSFVNFSASKEDFDLDASFEIYEKLDKPQTDRYEYILPNYNLSKNISLKDSLDGVLTFNSSGSQHIYDTNITETQLINDLFYESENKVFSNGIQSNYNILLKNVNTDGKNSTKYKNKLQSELVSSFIFESSYPLLREGINIDNYLTPKIALRYSPNSMKDLKNEDRRIDINNIFALDRIGFTDVVEPGQSLTIGTTLNGLRKKVDNNNSPNNIFELSLATVFRDQEKKNIPTSSSLGNKSSDLVGHINLTPNNFFSSNYYFSLDNNLDQFKYNELTTDFRVNNFITSFKFLEENDSIGDESYLQNTTSWNINENSSFSFSTRRNKKIDLTEFYDLIYEYKNDCLTAAIKFKKEYYTDNDIKPSEQLFFSLTIIPLGEYETANIIPK